MSSLKEKIYQTLTKLDPVAAEKWNNSYHKQNTGNFKEEVVEVNDYLRNQLGQLDKSTIVERECLIEDINEKDWLRNFSRYIAPTIAQHGLPEWSN